jgi:hypothetical protein
MESTLTPDQIEAQSLPNVTMRVFRGSERPELAKFGPMAAELTALVEQYKPLKIAGIDDKAGFAAVHEARIALRDKRIQVEETRKELKAGVLEAGRAIDAEAKKLTAIVEPVETALKAQEDAVEAERQKIKDAEAAQRRAVVQGRVDALKQLGTAAWFGEVETWSDAEFELRLKAAHEEANRREKAAAELARLEAERKEREAAEEKTRQEKLAAERAEMARVKAEQERIAAEQKAEADRLAAEKAKIEAAQQAERERIAAWDRRIAAEKQALEDAEHERKRLIDLEEAKRIAAEKALEEERRRQAEFEASRQREMERRKEETERLEAERPAREKILQFAQVVAALDVPNVPTVTAEKIRGFLVKAAKSIRELGTEKLS